MNKQRTRLTPEVVAVINSELAYGDKWEAMDRPKNDSEKSVEFWIAHMENYLDKARHACYGVDKTEALVNIRKVTALAVTCMTHHETLHR